MSARGGARIMEAARWLLSPPALFWMAAAWVFLYVSYSLWSKEAFGAYVLMLSTNPLLQLPYLVFIVSGSANLWRFAASRFRTSPLSAAAWVILPTGVLVYLMGFFMSAVMAQSGIKLVGLGDVVRPPWQQELYRVSSVSSGLAAEVMDMEAEGSPIFTFEPEIYLDTPGGQRRVGVFPPSRIGRTYYHILDFGIAPLVRVTRQGRSVSEGLVVMNLLPPGRTDSFTLNALPAYRMIVSMMPKREMSKGGQVASVYEPMTPAYRVVVQKGDETVFDGDTVDPVVFDGLVLEFGPPGYWIRLEASRNLGIVFIYAGVILIVLGSPLFVIAVAARMAGPLLDVLRQRKE